MQQASCQNCKTTFDLTDQDVTFYKTMSVPPPTFCPNCRFQRRMAHINTRSLYPRVLKEEEKPTISMYAPEKDYNIVEDKDWWSDKYDFFAYGRDYDFSQSFFAQFHKLWKEVPLAHLQRSFSTFENSDYCNAAAGLKNCYLLINADNDERCMYCSNIDECNDCADLSFANSTELSYGGVHLIGCYRCFFCEECESSHQLLWCKDCVGCTDCYGCMGLRHKQYMIFNQQYSKEDYEREMSKRTTATHAGQEAMQQECTAFFLTRPHKCVHQRNNEGVEGDYIYQSKNVSESFLVEKGEDCKFVHLLRAMDTGTTHAYDYTTFGVGAEYVYECCWCGLVVNNIKFSIWNYGASDLEYCIGCHYSKNMFGCIGLRSKQYCVFNKQYTKEEYEGLVARIKEQMMQIPYVDAKGNEYRYGEFFPIELSPFAYNETIAQDYHPISKEESLAQSYGWYDNRDKSITQFTHWNELPDDIRDVSDTTIAQPILCKAYDEDPEKALEHHCTQYFKIIPQELAFYKTNGLALPRYCHASRYRQRLQKLNPFHLWDRTCAKCNKEIKTSYSPDRPEIVYCEECYLTEVY